MRKTLTPLRELGADNNFPLPLYGAFRENEANSSNIAKNPSKYKRGEPVAYFTSVAEDLNSGLPRTNKAELGASGLQVQRSNHPATLRPLTSYVRLRDNHCNK